MREILINILIFSGIALLIALTVAAIQAVIILVDARKTGREISNKIKVVSDAVDIITLLAGGLGGAGKILKKKLNPDKSTLIAFVAGVKKGLRVLLNK